MPALCWLLVLLVTALSAEATASPLWIGTITTDAGLTGVITVANCGGMHPRDCASFRFRCLGPACPARHGLYGEDNTLLFPGAQVTAFLDFPVKFPVKDN